MQTSDYRTSRTTGYPKIHNILVYNVTSGMGMCALLFYVYVEFSIQFALLGFDELLTS